jgi:hypothetical protein
LLVPERSVREKSAWALVMLQRWLQRTCLRRKYNGRIDGAIGNIARKDIWNQYKLLAGSPTETFGDDMYGIAYSSIRRFLL